MGGVWWVVVVCGGLWWDVMRRVWDVMGCVSVCVLWLWSCCGGCRRECEVWWVVVRCNDDCMWGCVVECVVECGEGCVSVCVCVVCVGLLWRL